MGNSGTKSKPIDEQQGTTAAAGGGGGAQQSHPIAQSQPSSSLSSSLPQEEKKEIIEPTMTNVQSKPPSPRNSPPKIKSESPKKIIESPIEPSPPVRQGSLRSDVSPTPEIETPKPIQEIVSPNIDVEQFSTHSNVPKEIENFVESIDDTNSVEEFPRADSIEAFETSSLFQDRASDLTLEEPLQDFHDYDEIDQQEGDDQSKSLPNEMRQQRLSEEAKAMDYIRDICSPTVSFSLLSDQWAHRKEGLELIQKHIERSQARVKNQLESQNNEEFVLFCIILRKYFLDRVAPVFYAAYDAFRSLLKVYSNYTHGKEIDAILSSMVYPLLQNMGGESTGTNKRTQKEACRCILRISRLTTIDGLGLILSLLNEPSNSRNGFQTPTGPNTSQSLAQSTSTTQSIGIKQKLILMKLLINEFSITESCNGNCGSGISTDLVLNLCQAGVNHSDDKIRKASVDLMGIAYSKVGKSIKMYITDIKPAMLKVLEKKFAEIDAMNNPQGTSASDTLNQTWSSTDSVTSSSKSSSKKKSSSNGEPKSENIRNLAPVLVKKGPTLMSSTIGPGTGSSGNLRTKFQSNPHFNASFNNSATADGEENFVVMKNPSAPSPSVKSPGLHASSSLPSMTNNDKENESNTGIFSPNKTLTTSSKSKSNRFEISEVEVYSTPSPLGATQQNSHRKEKKIGHSNSSTSGSSQKMKSQTSSGEDNRFFIDESQY